jgi:hypothetical protein
VNTKEMKEYKIAREGDFVFAVAVAGARFIAPIYPRE